MTDVALDMPAPRGWLGRFALAPSVFVDPGEVFGQEARRPNAMIPIVVLIIGFCGLLLAYAGLMVDLALSAVPVAARAEVAPQLAAMVATNKWVALALTPLYVGGWVLVTGVIIFVAVSVLPGADTGEGGLHRSVSIAAYAYLAILLEELVSYVTLRAIGFDQLRYSWDLKPLPGLHYFVEDPQKNDVAFVVLQQLNLFTIAYGFLLAYGTRRVFGTSWVGAVITAVLAILAKVGIAALVAALKP